MVFYGKRPDSAFSTKPGFGDDVFSRHGFNAVRGRHMAQTGNPGLMNEFSKRGRRLIDEYKRSLTVGQNTSRSGLP